jgi:hypothetical protein
MPPLTTTRSPEVPHGARVRSNCEGCDRDLGPAASDAMICTYECTFCAD